MLESRLEVTEEDSLEDVEVTVEVTEQDVENAIKEVPVEDEEMAKLKNRTAQLFELIAFGAKNERNVQLYRNEIIELNIRLVPHILKRYKPFGDDEFQMGCIGLIIATNSFDPSRGVPYASYACFCIARELHKAHRHNQNKFEYIMGGNIVSLDEFATGDNGDAYSKHENITDEMSEAEFEKLLNDFSLDNIFDTIIMPSIEGISKTTKGQNTSVDFDHWRALELQYLIEMAEIDSQKARLSLTAMSQSLGVSTQNIRMRHKRVVGDIRNRCITAGYIRN